MTTLRPYPAYKDSGVDWLGDVPEHWDARRLKSLATLTPSKSEVAAVSDEQEVVFLPMEKVSSRGQVDSSLRRRLSDVRSGFTYFRNGDVIVAKITPCFENGKSALVSGLETGIGFGSTEFHVLRPTRKLEPRYLYRLISSQDFLDLGEQSMEGAGGQKRVPTDFVAGFETPLPPLDEQRAIADFLDGMDARITRFLTARRRMIALLEEQKQAVINQAVTRGLDPDVPLKDSGVDWLGEIPAHWEILRGGALFNERNETGYPNLPILEVSLVTGVTVRDLDDPKRKQMMTDRGGYKRAIKGDLPYNMMRMWQGAVGVAPVDGLVSPAYVVLKPKTHAMGHYYAALFRTSAFMGEVSRHSRGIVSDRDRLYWDSFKQIQMPFPPVSEQQRIVRHIDRETSRIDALIDRHRREIDLMQEYRTRLISDVVTGKLDVRGVELPPVEEIEAAMEEAPIPS